MAVKYSPSTNEENVTSFRFSSVSRPLSLASAMSDRRARNRRWASSLDWASVLSRCHLPSRPLYLMHHAGRPRVRMSLQTHAIPDLLSAAEPLGVTRTFD